MHSANKPTARLNPAMDYGHGLNRVWCWTWLRKSSTVIVDLLCTSAEGPYRVTGQRDWTVGFMAAPTRTHEKETLSCNRFPLLFMGKISVRRHVQCVCAGRTFWNHFERFIACSTHFWLQLPHWRHSLFGHFSTSIFESVGITYLFIAYTPWWRRDHIK